MPKQIIHTDQAPAPIGPYSQAIKTDNIVYISGQIALDPNTQQMIEADLAKQISQVFKNLQAVAAASGGSLKDIVKLNVYFTELSATEVSLLNEIMEQLFQKPYPARAGIGVKNLPKNALVEMDAVMYLG